MTAINIIRDAEAVHVFTDGASYRGDGTLGAVVQKVWPLAHLNAALVCRGPHTLGPLLVQRAGAVFGSFDELAQGLADLARSVSMESADIMRLCEIGAEFELFLAGWSTGSNAPASYVVASHDRYCEPWTLAELGPVAIAPFDEHLAEWCEINLDRLMASTSMASLAVELMEAQRGIRAQHGSSGPTIAGVGGFCQWTMIGEQTITTGIVKRWPDKLGEPLGLEVMPLEKRNRSSRPRAA